MIKKNATAALAASAALLAFVAAPTTYAQGNGGGSPAASQGQRGNAGGQGAEGSRQQSDKMDRKGPSAGQRDTSDRRGPPEASQRGNAERSTPVRVRDDSNRGSNGQANSARGNQGFGNDRRGPPGRNLDGPERFERANSNAFRQLRQTFGSSPRLIDGCPPGLAKKQNGCLPPGLAKNRYRSFEPSFFGLTGAERGQYFYQDGYLLRYRPDGLAGFLPLLGGALGIGNLWPNSYESRPLPAYYSDYFQLGDSSGYRYADNVIYRVNPETTAITSVVGLLTGDDIEIGRPMPRGYDVYNVPYSQRDQYRDTAQSRYRYANGYIYEIDPTSALVTSAVELLL